MEPNREIQAVMKEVIKGLGGASRWIYAGAISAPLNEKLGRVDLSYYSVAELGRNMARQQLLACKLREYRGQPHLFFKLLTPLKELENLNAFLLGLVATAGGDKQHVRIPTLVKLAREQGVLANGHTISQALRPLVLDHSLDMRIIKNGSADLKSFRLTAHPALDDLLVESVVFLKGNERWISAAEVAKDLRERHGVSRGTVMVGIALARLANEGRLKKEPGLKQRYFCLPQTEVRNVNPEMMILETLNSVQDGSRLTARELEGLIHHKFGTRLTPMSIGRFASKLVRQGHLEVVRRGRGRIRAFRVVTPQKALTGS